MSLDGVIAPSGTNGGLDARELATSERCEPVSSHKRVLLLLLCAVLTMWAVVPSAQEARYPARYLVFLGAKNGENGWLTNASPPLLISGDSVAPVAPAGSLLTGLTLTEMRAIVKGLK